MLERRLLRLELVHLVLGEIGDLEPLAAAHLAAHRLEVAGEQLGEGRLAVAVDADQRDAVVGIDAVGDVASAPRARHSPTDTLSKVIIGEAGIFLGSWNLNGAAYSSNSAAGGFSRWIILMRACACLALLAL